MATARIIEQGNGFPEVGDYCSGNGQLYEITEILGRIQTDDNRGNYFLAEVEEADYSDCSEEDEHSALVALED
jgi:hypothetical protein